jgi:DNA-binding MurR/RpiR family transcriptional regulator
MPFIEETVRKNYNKLTKSCQKIADFLLANMEEAAFLDIYDFGSKIGTSQSTVVRFARAIGYDGFPKMQEDLRLWLREQVIPMKKMEKSVSGKSQDIYNKIFDADFENLSSLKEEFRYEKFEDVVNTIINAKRVYVVGYRTSFPLAYLLTMYLTQVMHNVKLIDVGGGEVYDCMVDWGKSDVLIGISFLRYSRVTFEIVEYAKTKKCKIIGITDNQLSPIGKIADIVLTVRCNTPMYFNSYIAALSLINCLVGGIALRKKNAINLLRNRDEVFKQLSILLK